MLPTLPERQDRNPRAILLVLVALAGQGLPTTAVADAYSDARAALVAAYQQADYTAMRAAADDALAARPGYPGALFNRAFAEVLDGDADAALQTLTAVVQTGVDFGVGEIEEFAALMALPGWADYAQQAAALQTPIGDARVAYTHTVSDFVPEGIAIDADGVLYLGSIRHGQLVRIEPGADGSAEILSDARAAPHWSVFGMRFDPAGHLWFASAAIAEMADVDPDDLGRTGLFRYNVESGAIDHAALLPVSDEPQVLGDLIVVDADTLLATESLTGALYRYSVSDAQFETVVAPGKLRSMQGLTLAASGEHLYVADYVGGLSRIGLTDGRIERVKARESDSLFGIDGLYRNGDRLIAIQNGIQPQRVVEWTLTPDGLGISASRILARKLPAMNEPTLGTLHHGEFLFVANSHWNRFDRDSNLPTDLEPPVILAVQPTGD